MKKFISIAIILVMIISATAITASADSYNYNGPWDLQFNVKKADPANVIKDGRIGNGEYERLDVDNDPLSDGCQFWVAYIGNGMFEYGEEMMKTIEYYFSWDDTHGFNFAVRYKPHDLKQVLVAGTDPSMPRDLFLQNCGLQIELNNKEHRDGNDFSNMLYYAIARRSDNGDYLEGHYGQLGKNGGYDPVAGVDFCIEYDFDGGYITYEWSVPIDTVIDGEIGAGTKIYLSIGATAGCKDVIDPDDEGAISETYAVGLGNYSYMAKQTKDSTHVAAVLSDELVALGGQSDDPGTVTDEPSKQEDQTDEPVTNGDGTEKDDRPENTDKADERSVEPKNGNGESKKEASATKTGDVTVMLAVISVLCAAVVLTTKKHRA